MPADSSWTTDPRSAVSRLPCVPPPAADELLGAWLLRVAECYGTGLRGLLYRLGALCAPGRRMAHWFDLGRRGRVDFGRLGEAVRRSVEELAAMDAPHCQRQWPQELGCCPRCLAEDREAGRPPTWYRRWMHPLALACPRHGTWLEPVATHAMRAVATNARLGQFVLAHAAQEPSRAVDGDAVAGALWIEQTLVTGGAQSDTPLRSAGSRLAASVVATLIEMARRHRVATRAALAAGQLPGAIPRDPERLWYEDFTFRASDGADCCLLLPGRLRPRQAVLGAVGAYLLRPPGERDRHSALSEAALAAALSWRAEGWPVAVVDWVSAEAVSAQRDKRRLRGSHGQSSIGLEPWPPP